MRERRGVRILLVGCGEIGSRHLQAVAALPGVREIDVVDPRPEAMALGRARLAELPDRRPDVTVRWCAALEDASKGGEVCIVATQAAGRCQLVRQAAETLGYSSFLVEKLVAQSIEEYGALLADSRERSWSIWVNCKTRAYPIHKRIKARLDRSEPIVLTVVSGNHGLANSGIHTADLFAFYDDAARIECVGSRIDPVLHLSKRGADVFDLSGTLFGSTKKGSTLMLSYASHHQQLEQILVATGRYRCLVDHGSRQALESDADTGWAWRPVPFEGNVLISHMTRGFVSDVLASGDCELPTLEEASVAHRFILGELQPHFSRLSEQELARCPVA